MLVRLSLNEVEEGDFALVEPRPEEEDSPLPLLLA